MKTNILRLPLLYAVATTALAASGIAHAQNAAAPIADFYTPYYRGQAATESAFWSNSFTVPVGGPNVVLTNAPGGSALANASITQQTSGAQIISGGIYMGSSIGHFTLNYSVSNTSTLSGGVGSVLFQTETTGYQLDYGSPILTYTNASGPQSLSPVDKGQFFFTGAPAANGASSADVISRWQWTLPLGDGVTNFSISFNAATNHLDLGRAILDVSAGPNAGPFAMQSAPCVLAQWMYPFNPGEWPTAPVFSAFGYTGAFGESDPNAFYFDSRDGQYLVGWNTSNSIPAGQGAKNYLIRSVRVTLTIGVDMQWAYDGGILRDYRTYLPTNDPRYLPPSSQNSPVELYGAGFRGGFTDSNNVFVPYAATNYPTDGNGPFFADPNNPNEYTNRIAYSAGYDTNGLLVDVSDNVGDDGTNEIPNPFEVAPFAVGIITNVAPGQLTPEGTRMTFDLNLNDPLIYSYVQQALNQGNLSFIACSLFAGSQDSPNSPEFYTIFNVTADADQYPLLDIQGSVVRTNLDSDEDGLPDDWEQFYFTHLGAGATNSFTGDGVNNLAKYVAGTDPSNATNDLRVLAIQNQPGFTELHFNFAPSRQYSVQYSADLQNWQTVTNPVFSYTSAWLSKTGTNLVYPSPVYTVWRDTNAANQRFYRIGVH